MHWASSLHYGSYRTGDQRRLKRACPVSPNLRCSHTQTMEVDGQTKNQTSSPTGWLHMRIWNMNLRRTKSAIISWAGSTYFLSPVHCMMVHDCSKLHRYNEFIEQQASWRAKIFNYYCCVGVFTALRHFSGDFGCGQLTYPHCSWANLLGSLRILRAHSFASNWQLPFLNQQKGENGRRK